MYSEKVMEHFKNPKNQYRMDNPDGVGKVGNPICGDVMWIYVKIDQDEGEKGRISEISWETFGCTAAIATSSMVTELAHGLSIDEALQITKKEVADELDGLPPIKKHCSLLATEGLSEALYDYLEKNEKDIPQFLQKRHQDIKAEMEEIEEKYSDYIQMEEESQSSDSVGVGL